MTHFKLTCALRHLRQVCEHLNKWVLAVFTAATIFGVRVPADKFRPYGLLLLAETLRRANKGGDVLENPVVAAAFGPAAPVEQVRTCGPAV